MEGSHVQGAADSSLGVLASTIINTALENIQVEDAIVSGGAFTGGLVGEVFENSIIDTCRFNGKVSGFGHTGGLIGTAYSRKGDIIIKNSISQGAVSTFISKRSGDMGGFAAVLRGCTVSDSLSLGAPVVSGLTGNAGGFVGTAENTVFKSCESLRDVEGMYRVGGFAGFLSKEGVLISCRSSGDVYSEGSETPGGISVAGGFVGAAQGKELPKNANHSIKIVGSHASGGVRTKGGMAGGFAGSLMYTTVDAGSGSGDVIVSGTPDIPIEISSVGGFAGRLSHRSRITNACAYGDVNNPAGRQTGGFVGIITHGSGIEYAFSSGDVRGLADVGGFAGAVAAAGAPNTLFGCISFAGWVSAGGECIHRLVGRLDHEGVNNCYAYLGTVVAAGDNLRHVVPNPYGSDGGDINNQTIEGVLSRLGWDSRYWDYAWEDDILRKPRLISLNNF